MNIYQNKKIPPQNIEAEMSVLGSMMLDYSALNVSIELLKQDDFYKDAHSKIFSVMCILSANNEPCDIVTIISLLKQQNQLEIVGGSDYIIALSDFVPFPTNIKEYCNIVKDRALARKLINLASHVVQKGYEGTSSSELLENIQSDTFLISQGVNNNSYVLASNLVHDSVKHIQHMYEQDETVTGVGTGYVKMDKLTAGFQPGDLIILAARPSMGKTTLALNIMSHISIESSDKRPSVIFSLEMSKEQLINRFLASVGKIDSSKLRIGRLEQEEWTKLNNAANLVHNSNLIIDDTGAITISELRSKARRMKQEYNVSIIFIDYLQLMRSGSRSENRQQEISDISRSLKALAKELKIPIVALSQLNRTLEMRADKRPLMSDLRESGAIEQDADVIMFIYRETVYCEACKRRDGSCNKNHHRDTEVIFAKNRNGMPGNVNLAFYGEYTRFENVLNQNYS